MLKHTSPISGIASFNHQYVATAGYDNRIILWQAETRTPIAVGHHDHLCNQCEFSDCGNYLVTSSSDHTARLWSVPQLKLLAVFSEHRDDVECSAIHPQQSWVATASRDHQIRIFNFKGELYKEIRGHEADVLSIQWSTDGETLMSSSDDGTIRVWDVQEAKQLAQLNDSGIQTDALAISSEGIVFAGDDAGQIHVIFEDHKQSIAAHQAGIKKIVYSDTLKKLMSVAYDRKACLWDVLSSGEIQCCAELTLPPLIWARSCAFHGDSEILFATFGDTYAIYDYHTQLWQIDHINPTHGINAIYPINNHIYTVGDAGIVKMNQQAVQKLPSLCNFLVQCGNVLLTGGQTGEVFDAQTGTVVYRHRSPLNCAVSADDEGENVVIIGSYTGEAVMLKENLDGSVRFVKIIPLHDNAIKGLAVNDDILFSICATGAVAWYDLKNNQVLKFIREGHHKIANGCVALEKMQFASVSRDLLLRIWDTSHCALKAEIQTPHTHSIKCIATDVECRYLATGAYNGTVCIYDRIASTWHTVRLTHAGISSICFDQINHQFLASSYDGKIYPVRQGAII